MSVFLAWRNALDNKVRAATSVIGIGVVMLLLYMQLGFYDTCFRSSTLVYEQFDFDLLLISPHYVHLRFAGQFPQRYLARAKQVPGVANVAPVHVVNADYQLPTDARQEVMVLAVDPGTRTFRVPDLRRKVPLLKAVETAIADEIMIGMGLPKLQSGDEIQVAGTRIRIADTYRYGAGFIADTVMVVSRETLGRMAPGFSVSNVSLGLVQLEAGRDAESVVKELRGLFQDEVRVVGRSEIERSEQYFFVHIKPMGVQFGAGVLLAMFVSVAVLYQLLATSILRRSREYATLKAVGYTSARVYHFVFQEAMLLVVFGLVPATALALLVYDVTRDATNLPIAMTWQRVVLVAIFSLLISGLAGFAVARRIVRCDPADLF